MNRIPHLRGVESLRPGDFNGVGAARSRTGSPGQKTPEGSSFGELLSNALSEVKTLENHSDEMTRSFATGESDDIAGAVVAAEKAQLAMGTVLKVRQEILEAYDNIMRMQV